METTSQIENWEALWLGAIGVTSGSRVGDAEPVLLEAVLTLFFGCHVRSFHTRLGTQVLLCRSLQPNESHSFNRVLRPETGA